MGVLSTIGNKIIHPVDTVRDLLGMTTPGAPGVGGARPDQAWALTPVPGTGLEYNSVTGQYYVAGTGGTQVAAAPNLAQQTSGNVGIAGDFLGEHQAILDRMAATRAGQDRLGGNLEAVISGHAPSVAGVQLQTGMSRIAADQASQAAGAAGPNAFAAQRIAANNTARAQTDLSGQLALARAQEVTAANNSLASLYSGEAGADAAANSTAANTGLGYSGLAERGAADELGVNSRANEQNAKTNAGIIRAGGTAAGLF